MKVQTRPDDRPLNGTVRMSEHRGNFMRQCVRCGRRWQVKPKRPDLRHGMCVDCHDVDPEFGAKP